MLRNMRFMTAIVVAAVFAMGLALTSGGPVGAQCLDYCGGDGCPGGNCACGMSLACNCGASPCWCFVYCPNGGAPQCGGSDYCINVGCQATNCVCPDVICPELPPPCEGAGPCSGQKGCYALGCQCAGDVCPTGTQPCGGEDVCQTGPGSCGGQGCICWFYCKSASVPCGGVTNRACPCAGAGCPGTLGCAPTDVCDDVTNYAPCLTYPQDCSCGGAGCPQSGLTCAARTACIYVSTYVYTPCGTLSRCDIDGCAGDSCYCSTFCQVSAFPCYNHGAGGSGTDLCKTDYGGCHASVCDCPRVCVWEPYACGGHAGDCNCWHGVNCKACGQICTHVSGCPRGAPACQFANDNPDHNMGCETTPMPGTCTSLSMFGNGAGTNCSVGCCEGDIIVTGWCANRPTPCGCPNVGRSTCSCVPASTCNCP